MTNINTPNGFTYFASISNLSKRSDGYWYGFISTLISSINNDKLIDKIKDLDFRVKLDTNLSILLPKYWRHIIVIIDHNPHDEVKFPYDVLDSNIITNMKTYIMFYTYNEFFNPLCFEKFIFSNNKDYNSKNIIFIFRNVEWFSLIKRFRNFGIVMSGGLTTKRHLLSPEQIRLSLLLSLLYTSIEEDILENSHNSLYYKEIYKYNKNKNNIINPFSNQKREFHSSNVKKKEKNIFLFNYLDEIKNIINNSFNSPIQSQEIIENKWIEIITERLNNQKYLVDTQSHRLFHLLNDAMVILESNSQKNIINKKFPLFKEEIIKKEYFLLSFSSVISYHNKLRYTSLCILIGNNISYDIFKKYKKLNKELENNFTFDVFKRENNLNISFFVKLGDYFLSILSSDRINLFEKEYIYVEDDEYYIIKINENYLDEIKNNIILHPNTLPMICKPNLWSCNSFGGFLDNKNKGESVITGSSMHNHIIENKKPLYDSANYLNSIKFSINNLLLDYLKNEGNYLLDKVKSDDELQRVITLKIAETYKNVPFYLNVHADWRGRLYTQSFFITYQGSDISSALLNLWDGEVLTDSGKYYFYIYGANNHNENNISKCSFIERVKWVQNNYNKIINLDKELILSAENPFIFTSFCLNMREIHFNYNYLIKTPIFLDATCNGIQHLAAILQDIELGSKVNLTSLKEKESPKDIYSELLDPINKAINKYGKKIKDYNLSMVKFDRKILKQSIMTKIYNVTTYGISQQLKSKLEKKRSDSSKITNQMSTLIKKELKNNTYKKDSKNIDKVFLAPGKYGTSIILTPKEIYQIASIINKEIFVIFPSLNGIYNYFINISNLMIKLGIPLTWITPTGMKITQHYLKTKKISIAISFGGKLKKMVLRERTDILNKQKQIQAIIPNIIHSLDATHLIYLINKANSLNFKPIISIHDCFGTHPNKMEELEFMVKKEFILLYTKDNFLETFHSRILQSIKDNNFKIIEDSNYENDIIILERNNFNKIKNKFFVIGENLKKREPIPDLPKLGKLDLEKIIESKYMIN